MKLQIDLINDTPLPKRAHMFDAGADLYITKDFTISPRKTEKIPLGIKLHLPSGTMAVVHPRSSLALEGLITHNAPIDCGYTGEIHAIITNTKDFPHTFKCGERIAQLVVYNILLPDFIESVDTNRSVNGFGSTGK